MVTPVNPVDQSGDFLIKEAYQRPIKTDLDKEKAFNEFLIEQVFINNMFNGENSIYKPDPEEKEDEIFSGTSTTLYGDIAKKQIARYLAENNLDLVKPTTSNIEKK